MSISTPDVADALTLVAAAASLPGLLDALEVGTYAVGGDGVSLGVLDGDEVRQTARGFDHLTPHSFATFPSAEQLPGPAALRSLSPVLLADTASTLERFPGAAAILSGSDFEAAACLPLTRGAQPLGYLAVHYRGPRRFEDVEVQALQVLAAGVSGAVARLATPPVHDESEWAPGGTSEVAGLGTALGGRAVIEQAKGMLMQRFGVTAEAAWQVLRRYSSTTGTGVRVLAERIIDDDGLTELTERLVAETARAHHVD